MEEFRNQQADPRTRMQAIRELLAEVNEQIAAELNDQQKQLWQKRIAELRERMQQRLRDAGQGPRANEPGPRGDGGPLVGLFARLQEAAKTLDLSDDQQKQLADVFAELRKELGALRDAGGDPRQIREKVQQLQQQLRERLATILTPEQLRVLQEKMRSESPRGARPRNPGPAPDAGNNDDGEPQRPFVDRGRGNAEPPPRARSSASAKPDAPTEPRTPAARSGTPAAAAPVPPAPGAVAPAPPAPAAVAPAPGKSAPVGSTDPPGQDAGNAPAVGRDESGQEPSATQLVADPKPLVVAELGKPAPDLTVIRADGRPMQLSSLRGKPTVMVFGSFSCPSFRQRVPDVNAVAATLSIKINLVYVYTREAHPVGQWEVQRNLDENIRIDAHKSLAERLNQARQAQTSLKLAGQVIVDDMDDRVARTFDGFHNGAVLLDRDGVMVLKQKWCDPSGWQAAIDDALARPMKR